MWVGNLKKWPLAVLTGDCIDGVSYKRMYGRFTGPKESDRTGINGVAVRRGAWHCSSWHIHVASSPLKQILYKQTPTSFLILHSWVDPNASLIILENKKFQWKIQTKVGACMAAQEAEVTSFGGFTSYSKFCHARTTHWYTHWNFTNKLLIVLLLKGNLYVKIQFFLTNLIHESCCLSTFSWKKWELQHVLDRCIFALKYVITPDLMF